MPLDHNAILRSPQICSVSHAHMTRNVCGVGHERHEWLQPSVIAHAIIDGQIFSAASSSILK